MNSRASNRLRSRRLIRAYHAFEQSGVPGTVLAKLFGFVFLQ
jgi:hypothetical protein